MTALSAPAQAVAPLDSGNLNAPVAPTDSTITIAPIFKYLGDVKVKQGFNTSTGFCLIQEGDKTERISYSSASVDATTKITTLSGVTRGLSLTSTTASYTAGTGCTFSKGSPIFEVNDITNIQDAATKSNPNTYSQDQTLASGKKIYLGDTGNYIKGTASGDIEIASNTTAAKTFSELAAAAGTDEKVKVSATDTTVGYLLAKIPSGNGVTMTQTGGGGNETLVPSINLDTDPGLVLGSNKLKAKVKANSGLTLDSDGLSIATQGAAGTILTSTGATSAPTFQEPTSTSSTVYVTYADSTLSNPTSVTAFGVGYTIPANDLVAGVVYEVEAFGQMTSGGSYTAQLAIMLGTSFPTYVNFAATSFSSHYWSIRGYIVGTTTAGATSAVRGGMTAQACDGSGTNVNAGMAKFTENIATNASKIITVGASFGTSSGSNSITMSSLKIKKLSTTAF